VIQERKLRVRAPDGAESDATVFVVPEIPPRAVVVCFPAMGVAASYYAELARALARPGICVVTAELRGIGSSSLRASRAVNFGYRELVTLDLPSVIAAARAEVPDARLVLLGHSIGAHLSAMYASVNPGTVDALVFAAAGTSYFRCWDAPMNRRLFGFAWFTRAVSGVLGYFPGRRFGFFGTEARRLIGEWATLTTRGRFEVRGAAQRFEDTLPTLRAPVLALSFAGDEIAPQAAVEHFLAKMPQASVTRVRMRPDELGAPALDHFRWAKYPGAVADRIAAWLKETAGVLPE